MSELKINPTFRDLIPPLSPYELEALEAEIRHWARAYAPIITWNGTIVDGHHRYEICKKYNLPFKVEEREFEDELSTKRWIIACQFARRNMPLDVRLDLAFQDEEFEMEQARKRQACGQGGVLLSPLVDTGKVETGRTLEKIAKKALCGRQTAFEYKKIKEAGLVDRVKQDGESIKKVYCDLKLKEEKAKVVEKLESLEVKEVKATEGVYDVISIDPPWDVEDVWSRSAHAGYKPLQYPTMSVEEIKEMKLQCADDCHVFLWTTQKFLPKAFDVLKRF
uniref:MT-A70 n=1 Tax=Candidatus Kentrum sp. SD TaxID=2126332 RepID=A0A450YSF7_9GAMM|nr:MAG: MT-A70 [Candidatus Kentron sp. SD]VFK44477.1 MAG: MT-A70 [Candidatus Kentron sp. SD]